MRLLKTLVVISMIFCLMLALGCDKNEPAPADKDGPAAEGSSAVSGGKIDTNDGNDEEEAGDTVIEDPEAQEDPDGDGNIGITLPKPDEEEAEPIEGTLTLNDLVYPVTDPRSGNSHKEDIGDLQSYSMTTGDPFIDVWMYYSQILQGRDFETENNLGDQGKAPLNAFFKIEDSGNEFMVRITEESPAGMVLINIAKR
jgi:hypothetical protein